jgi:hypothetical protein
MVFEEKFLKELGDQMITYYFGPEKQMHERIIMEEQSEVSAREVPFEPTSVYEPKSSDLINIQDRVRRMLEEEKGSKKPGLPPIFKKGDVIKRNDVGKLGLPEMDHLIRKPGSMSLVELKKIRKSCKLKSNITSIAKRYATYLFTSANLDKDKDVFSKKQFCSMLLRHPSIFDVYLAGFHTQVWECEANGKPKYMTVAPIHIEGECKMTVCGLTSSAYLKLSKMTILVFDHKDSDKPKDIINLEGLTIVFGEEAEHKPVVLSHRDNFYPEKKFTFPEKENEWLKELEYYK